MLLAASLVSPNSFSRSFSIDYWPSSVEATYMYSMLSSLSAGMILTMADASLSQHVDTGLGAVANCRADIYGPQVHSQQSQTISHTHKLAHQDSPSDCTPCAVFTCHCLQPYFAEGLTCEPLSLAYQCGHIECCCRAFSTLGMQWLASCA